MRWLFALLAVLGTVSSRAAADSTSYCYDPVTHRYYQSSGLSCVRGDAHVSNEEFDRSGAAANAIATVLRTRDGQAQIALPAHWVETSQPQGQRAQANTIFAANGDEPAFLLVHAKRKSDAYELKDYSARTMERLTRGFEHLGVSDGSEIRVSGRPAMRYRYTGSQNGFESTGVVTIIEFETRTITLAVWSSSGVFAERWHEFYSLAEGLSEPVGAMAQKPPAVSGSPSERKPAQLTVVTGTGFVLSVQGQILTNNHVVNDCVDQIYGALPGKPELKLRVVARDPRNDLALLMAPAAFAKAVALRGASIRPGDTVIAIGYPLFGMLSSEPVVTTGIVNSLGGLDDDSRFLQISATVQPGNSGGPLLDMAGNVVGVVTQKINQLVVARETGSLPENINFALKTGVVRDFLEKSAVQYQVASAGAGESTVPEIAARARNYTLLVWCKAAIHE